MSSLRDSLPQQIRAPIGDVGDPVLIQVTLYIADRTPLSVVGGPTSRRRTQIGDTPDRIQDLDSGPPQLAGRVRIGGPRTLFGTRRGRFWTLPASWGGQIGPSAGSILTLPASWGGQFGPRLGPCLGPRFGPLAGPEMGPQKRDPPLFSEGGQNGP